MLQIKRVYFVYILQIYEKCMKSVNKSRYDKCKLVGLCDEIFWYL